MPGCARFIRIWLASLAALAALVAGINLLVDPYDLFGTPRIPGISLLKPAAKNHAMLAKTYQIARAHPVTVLIGSSSTHIGLDSDDPAWPPVMRPVYNYGIPGTSTTDSLDTLREALVPGGAGYAFVSLDFQNFLVPENAGEAISESGRRFHTLAGGAGNPYRPHQILSDIFLSLATMGALADSLYTIAEQSGSVTLNLAPNGSSNEAEFIRAARSDGMHDLFAQKQAAETERAKYLKGAGAEWTDSRPNLDIVARIIALAADRDVKLTLFLVPHHAGVLELYWRSGLWPRIEQLKTELADLVASQGKGVVLWDFLEYGSFTAEPVPDAADRRSATQWFWEPNHFKKQLGGIMIKRMLGEDAPEFGVVLTPGSVAARNRDVRAQRQAAMCARAGVPKIPDLPLTDACEEIAPADRRPGAS
nr:hypothetical protein [uncultured Rhodopila sp.]